MDIPGILNLYLLKNRELVYFLLQSIKDCILEEHREKYALQLECINKIQWALDVEADLYFDNGTLCKEHLIAEWEREKIVAKAILVDENDKKYRLDFTVVNGRIFSIEGALPFRYLQVGKIRDIRVVCSEQLQKDTDGSGT